MDRPAGRSGSVFTINDAVVKEIVQTISQTSYLRLLEFIFLFNMETFSTRMIP